MAIRLIDDQLALIQLPHGRMVQVAQFIRTGHRGRGQCVAIGVRDLIANGPPYIEPQLLARR